MIFCACATRGRGPPSLGLMARFGVPGGGRVRRLRAVEDQSAPIPEETTSELGGSIYIVRCALQVDFLHDLTYSLACSNTNCPGQCSKEAGK